MKHLLEDFFFENKHFAEINPLICGQEQCLPLHSCGPEIRNHYLIHYVISGKGILRMNHTTYRISGGQVFLIKPYTMFFYQADKEDPWHYIWIGFSGKYADIFKSFPDAVFKMDSYPFQKMLDVKYYNGTESEFLAGRLFILISEIFKTSSSNHVDAVINYIKTNYMRNISISGIADQLSLNRCYLSSLFKKATGKSIQTFLLETKIHESLNLLKNGYSINEVASLVGYADSFTFSKAFKRVYGKSPKNFREIL